MIVTFYSYKGGVGRSMALANVARWLQLRGLHVRVVDWDLEAPGVDTFFYGKAEELERARSQFGLIDLLLDYVERHPALDWSRNSRGVEALRTQLPPIDHAFLQPPPPAATERDQPLGRLELLGAGRRDGENFSHYADAVHGFDWHGLYADLHGLAYFDWLREQFQADCDVVLIDSRTGVTEMGGVCARQMADVVVVLSAPNDQNLDGTRMMVESFALDDELLAERNKRPLHILMVPARVDLNSEYKDGFARRFGAVAQKYWPLRGSPVTAWDLRIPYMTRYAYREQLAIGEADGDSDMQTAYRRLAAHVAWLADSRSHRHLMACMQAEFEQVFGAEYVRRRFQADDVLRKALDQLQRPGELDNARSLLTRMVVVPQNGLGQLFPRQLSAKLLDEPARELATALIEALVLAQSTGAKPVLGFTSPEFVQTETIRGWVDEDWEFLQWRQRLQQSYEYWEESGRLSGALLVPRLVEEATSAVEQPRRLAALLRGEVEFIDASRSALEEAARAATNVGRARREMEEKEARALQAAEEALGRARHSEERVMQLTQRVKRISLGVSAALLLAVAGAAVRWHATRAEAAAELRTVAPTSGPAAAAGATDAARPSLSATEIPASGPASARASNAPSR